MGSYRTETDLMPLTERFLRIVALVAVLGLAGVALWAVGTASAEDHAPRVRPVQIGNFLAEDARWTTHVLMSPHISDADRQAIVERCKRHGMNRIHLYGTNDDNYSERRGGGWWKGIKNRAVFYGPDDFDHWFHWLVQCRRAGLSITLWLWPQRRPRHL